MNQKLALRGKPNMYPPKTVVLLTTSPHLLLETRPKTLSQVEGPVYLLLVLT